MSLTLKGKFLHFEGLVGRLGSRHDRSVTDERVVNTRVRNQVGLELVQINVEGTIESQRGSDRADNLSNQTVKVVITGTGNVQIAATDVVNGLIVDQERAVGVLNGAVGGQDGIVGLDDGGGDTRRWVDGELELGLLAILGSKTLKDESTKTRAGTTTEGVEDEEALERAAVICGSSQRTGPVDKLSVSRSLTNNTSYSVHDTVDHLFANGVVTTGIVVGGILLSADQLFRVEELAVGASADLVDGRRVKIDEERTGDVFAAARLGEEGIIRTLLTDILGIRIRSTVRAKAVLEEVTMGSSQQRLLQPKMLESSEKKHTAPKQSYPAGYQPGRDEGEESIEPSISKNSSFIYDDGIGVGCQQLGNLQFRMCTNCPDRGRLTKAKARYIFQAQ